MRQTLIALFALCLALPAGQAQADELVGSYAAYIGTEDLYNSRGERLREPWQILRQDRANYHRFGISQPSDEWDPFFDDIDNRAAYERMLRDGKMDDYSARHIVAGGVLVIVNIFGRGSRGTRLEVDVYR